MQRLVSSLIFLLCFCTVGCGDTSAISIFVNTWNGPVNCVALEECGMNVIQLCHCPDGMRVVEMCIMLKLTCHNMA